MISIVQQPGDISLSRNPMIVEFLATDGSGNLYSSQGVRSELRESGTVGIKDGETLIVNWTEPNGADNSITFTAKDNPTLETEIPTKLTPGIGVSVSDYWEATAEAIAAHPDIDPIFSVFHIVNTVGSSYSLWIEVKEISDDWTLTMDDSGIVIASTSVFNYSTSTGSTAPDNYKILLDVIFEESYLSNDFCRISKIELPLNDDSRAFIDLGPIIHNAVKDALPELGVPEFSSNTPYRNDVYRRYYFRYREKYDGDAEDWANSVKKRALCGGIAQNLFANYDLFQNLKATNSLLTYYPNGKMVSEDQPEWIAWYNYDDASHQVLLQVTTWTADSDTSSVIYRLDGNGVTVNPMEVIELPVGFTQLSLGSSVVKYQIQVIDQADYPGTITTLSQSRTFYVDRLPYKEKRYIMYINSFCVPETVRCLGDFKDELNISRQIMFRPLPPDYSEAAAQVWQYDQDYINRFTYRTGYLSRIEIDTLQELLIYNDAYEVFSEGYIRLHITNNRHDIYDTSEFLLAHTIQAEPRLKRKNYSNIFIPLTEGQDAWITAADDYWLTVFSEPWQTP